MGLKTPSWRINVTMEFGIECSRRFCYAWSFVFEVGSSGGLRSIQIFTTWYYRTLLQLLGFIRLPIYEVSLDFKRILEF